MQVNYILNASISKTVTSVYLIDFPAYLINIQVHRKLK